MMTEQLCEACGVAPITTSFEYNGGTARVCAGCDPERRERWLQAISDKLQRQILAALDYYLSDDIRPDIEALDPKRVTRLRAFRDQLAIEPIPTTYLDLVKYCRSIGYDYLGKEVALRIYRLSYRAGMLWLEGHFPGQGDPLRDDRPYEEL